jgi:hypothetical protein
MKEIRGISLVFREMWDTTALDLWALKRNRLSIAENPTSAPFPADRAGMLPFKLKP